MKTSRSSTFPSVRRWGRIPFAIAAATLVSQALPAADLTNYGVTKFRAFEQTGALPGSPPSPTDYGFYTHAYQSTAGALLFGLVTGPGGLPSGLSENGDDPQLLDSTSTESSQSALDSANPNGTYAFQLFNSMGQPVNSQLVLTGDAYPTAPGLANFAAAQDINRAQPFALQWTKPAQLDAADYVVVLVRVDGNLVYSSPFPWQLGALSGTTITHSIPANILPETGAIEGEIDFVNVTARETQLVPGATGLAAYGARTTFPLKVHADSGGGGGDTTAPTLLSVSPTLGSIGVSPSTPVIFNFSEAMKPLKLINWFGPPNVGTFTYAWSVDGKSLTCTYPGGFPPSTSITWQLVGSGFADLAGNPLGGNNLAGQFFTSAGGSTNPCQNGTEGRVNSFFLARLAYYTQTSAAAPAPVLNGVDDTAATFLCSFSPSGLSVSAAVAILPGGARKTLTSQFGQFFLIDSFPSETALIAAYPNGAYSSEITLTGGTKSTQSVTVGNGSNTPHNSNFDPAQAINAAAAFTLSWDPFLNPTANDRIEITIYDDLGQIILHLPDECATPPKPLAVTATSVTLPANLLKPAKIYPVELTFSHIGDFKSNAAPAVVTLSAFNKTTRFNIKTLGGGTPNSIPVITGYRVAADARFEVDVTGAVGHTIKLEASDLVAGWTTVGSAVVPAGGKVTVRDSRLANLKAQEYRVRSE